MRILSYRNIACNWNVQWGHKTWRGNTKSALLENVEYVYYQGTGGVCMMKINFIVNK